ncbi:MAG: hypothetical protein IJ300_05325, partial [Clostridia bacterium]|nr:hypothetical protein [Clostridia bacterium]
SCVNRTHCICGNFGFYRRMKRLQLTLFAILNILLPCSVYAAVGDVAGNVYSTDIKAYVDGMEIQSYCLEGKTAISVEALREYGFEVTYYDDERTLFIERGAMPNKAPDFTNSSAGLPVGTVISNYYETDIKTYMDGYRVQAYALNGFTVVAIEDLTEYKHHHEAHGDFYSLDYAMHRPFNDLGFYHIWNDCDRTISLNCLRGGYVWRNELGDFTAGSNYIYHIQKAGTSHYALKAAINDTVYNWYLLKVGMDTYGLYIDPKTPEELYINTTPDYITPSYEKYDQGYFMEYHIIAPAMSKEIVINGTPFYAQDMFIPVQNYLYVREDLFEVLEKFN